MYSYRSSFFEAGDSCRHGMMKITPSDLSSVPFAGRQGYCMAGCRRWAAAQGFDWVEFVREGIDAERLLATGDAMAEAVVRYVQKDRA